MPDLSRSELAAYAACAVLIALLGWRALRADAGRSTAAVGAASPVTRSQPESQGTGAVTVGEAPAGPALVHVVGAVRRPGVYRMHAGDRVQDAIRRAGGARRGADLQAINLAAKLVDAQQVVVPRRGSAPSVGASPTDGTGVAANGPPISLSTATAEQLDTLDGVGPATAQKIIEYRAQHGGFRSVDELDQIGGIGPKRLEALRGHVEP